MSASLAVIILTLNEERHLERAIRSVAPIATEIVVVDSYSSDKTVEIARSLGARVDQHKFVNHAEQFQWAMEHIPLTSSWVLRLDADEYLTPELRDEIATKLPTLDANITGVIINRRHIFLGRFIRYGGRYPLAVLRLWRKGTARIEQRWMDEHLVLLRGYAVNFEQDFCDDNLSGVTAFIEKHNGYATREAIDVLNRRYKFLPRDTALVERPWQKGTSVKRLLKERIYNHLPFATGPVLYFLYRYFIQLGFLDGREGFAYHFLQGFWYRVLVSVKVMEYELAIAGLQSKQQIIDSLRGLTGLDLGREIQSQPELSASGSKDRLCD
jgi:glycosyltransferase involved in cell wall biosynthesis